MAERKGASSPLEFGIGNCKFTVEGKGGYSAGGSALNHEITTYGPAKIKIWVDDPMKSLLGDLGFVLVNPKVSDEQGKSILQEVLKLYVKELPAMNYAANTGKQSNFLERCVSSGKFCTLVFRSSYRGLFTEVIAALTYQIIPADTQCAEVPLAAVSSNYQHKGIGRLLYSELRKRLESVGICTIFCWGDKESEGFWFKQGFETIAEVNAKGKARRLPIRADIRKALCFPGGSSLMVSHLNNYLEPHLPLIPQPKSPVCENRQKLGGVEACYDTQEKCFTKDRSAVNKIIPQMENMQYSADDKFNEGSQLEVTHDRDGDGAEHCSYSMQNAKRNIWETTLSSIKSKKVKGGHHISNSSWDHNSEHEGNKTGLSAGLLSTYKGNDFGNAVPNEVPTNNTSKEESFTEAVPKEAFQNECLPVQTEDIELDPVAAREDHIQEQLLLKGEHHRIMLMDIADDTKKTFLTKIVENLGGSIVSDGSISTHIITVKARRTLNFCVALCSGAWIISTSWLKESFRQGKFVDELPFMLVDEEYVLKYSSDLKDAVLRAKACPRALLKGYDICLAKHVHPPVNILLDIVRSAGGNVLRTLRKVHEPSRTIFVACEEDMEEAMLAAKKGVWTFSSDWFMSCIMRQELDMQAPQFAESL